MAGTAALDRSLELVLPTARLAITSLRMFDGFELLRCGHSIRLGENVQRLLAYLALTQRPQPTPGCSR